MLKHASVLTLFIALLPALDAAASDWSPSRSIQIIVPSQAGGPVDTWRVRAASGWLMIGAKP